MQLPSMIKGWYKPEKSAEQLLTVYIKTGDRTLLADLVDRFNVSLYHYLLTQSNKELAEDMVQTTWLKVMQTKQVNTSHSNVKAWLYTIARNSLIDEFRRQQKWQNVLLDEDKIFTDSLEQSLMQASRLQQFNQALSQLPFLQREAFVLQQDGFSVHEIAQLTDCSFETAKSRLRYARKNLSYLLGTPS